MPEVTAVSPAKTSMSRRRLTTMTIGSALTGAVWTTSLAVLARGRHPQVFALGADEWQVLLLEHGTNRIIILVGAFKESPEPAIDMLCGLLRQHIDVVVGSGEALGLLSSSFRARRAVTTFVDTNGSPSHASSRRYVSLSDAVQLRAGALHVEVAPLPDGQWKNKQSKGQPWIVHVTIGDLTIAIGPTLDVIADSGHIDAALAIAPEGDVARLWRTIPGIAVATNSRDSLERLDEDASAADTMRLVRTFDRDIAAFVVRDGRIQLPDWTRETHIVDGN
ncbi:MAG: hypothetical protein M3457_13040 [Chloroflexota bacterium]|nr:hypothetical protein [Chloroflexota bacterium]